MATSDFTIQDLVNHERPISLYIVVPNSDRDRLAPLLRLIFTIIIHRLTEAMVFSGGTQQENLHKRPQPSHQGNPAVRLGVEQKSSLR